MGKHALLSASSSKRWMNCTPSARLEEQFKEEESVYAAEGTAAHALAEHKVRKYLKMRSKKPKSDFDSEELDNYTDEYVSYVIEMIVKAKKTCKDPVILVEAHLDYSCYVPSGFGTGDLVIVSDGTLQIIDLKYGQGLAVEAEWNSQMMLYSLGALELFDVIYNIEKVSMTIHQPRLEAVSTWEIAVDELKKWADETLRPKADLAIKGEGEFTPGSWCRFCKARNKCRARADSFLKLAQMEFKPPALLADDELTDVLGLADELSKWAQDVYAYAQDEAINHGKQWNGFKLVQGRSNRKYSNEDEVVKAAKNAGYIDIFKNTLIGISEMEKLMGKKNFNEILGNLIYKPQGKVTLVGESDKRQAINKTTAEAEFQEE
jgi:hypothetical protein